MPQYPASSPPGALGNPGLREDGSVEGLSSPVPASPSTPAPRQPTPEEMAPVLAARARQAHVFQSTEDRLPKTVMPRDQAQQADGNFGRGR